MSSASKMIPDLHDGIKSMGISWSFSISSRTSRCSAVWSQLKGGNAVPKPEEGAGRQEQNTGQGHGGGVGG